MEDPDGNAQLGDRESTRGRQGEPYQIVRTIGLDAALTLVVTGLGGQETTPEATLDQQRGGRQRWLAMQWSTIEVTTLEQSIAAEPWRKCVGTTGAGEQRPTVI
uniref:Uncharacterized protein n=1 Tax=Arundo donax TaxID=35708 RepID=A0A0A9FZ28_ARUDO